jgi:hypothetical protein
LNLGGEYICSQPCALYNKPRQRAPGLCQCLLGDRATSVWNESSSSGRFCEIVATRHRRLHRAS